MTQNGVTWMDKYGFILLNEQHMPQNQEGFFLTHHNSSLWHWVEWWWEVQISSDQCSPLNLPEPFSSYTPWPWGRSAGPDCGCS